MLRATTGRCYACLGLWMVHEYCCADAVCCRECSPFLPPQAGRGHLKALMGDLEGEQERAAGLVAALEEAREAKLAAESAQARGQASSRGEQPLNSGG